MDSYIDTIFDATNEIGEIAYQLQGIAKAFYVVGNNTMSEDLQDMAMMLERANKTISRAVGQEQNDRLQSARDGVNKTLITLFEVSP